MDQGRANILAMALDCVEAVVTMFWSLLVMPWHLSRRFTLAKSLCYIKVLLPQGLLSAYLRTRIDLRLKHVDRAIVALESMIAMLEDSLPKSTTVPRVSAIVLVDFYGQLASLHLQRGQINDAALTVIRAQRSVGVERLAGLADFDIRMAYFIKNVIAAGGLVPTPIPPVRRPKWGKIIPFVRKVPVS